MKNEKRMTKIEKEIDLKQRERQHKIGQGNMELRRKKNAHWEDWKNRREYKTKQEGKTKEDTEMGRKRSKSERDNEEEREERRNRTVAN